MGTVAYLTLESDVSLIFRRFRSKMRIFLILSTLIFIAFGQVALDG